MEGDSSWHLSSGAGCRIASCLSLATCVDIGLGKARCARARQGPLDIWGTVMDFSHGVLKIGSFGGGVWKEGLDQQSPHLIIPPKNLKTDSQITREVRREPIYEVQPHPRPRSIMDLASFSGKTDKTTIKVGKRAEYCFESTVSEKRTQ